MTITYLTLENLLVIVDVLDLQIRDLGMLASAAARPQTAIFGQDAYPDIPSKSAALMHSLARNHALVDGNQRVTWIAGRLFLTLNQVTIDVQQDEAFDTMMALAAGELEVAELARWIAARTT